MRKFLSFFPFLFFTLAAFGRGDSVGTGEGIAEKNFVYGYQRIGEVLPACLQTEACGVNEEEKGILKDILANLPNELPIELLLQFLPGEKYPEIFLIDGALKIAVTSLKVGTPIYINTDLIYPKNEMGQPKPMSVPNALATLVHELGHHQGIKDHTKLDSLGSKIESFLNSKSQIVKGDSRWSHIEAFAFHVTGDLGFTNLILHDGTKYLDFKTDIQKVVTCDPFLGKSKLVGAHIWNLHWAGGATDIHQQVLRARVEQYCQLESGKVVHYFGYSQLEINPSLSLNSNKVWEISEKPIITEVLCYQQPNQCF